MTFSVLTSIDLVGIWIAYESRCKTFNFYKLARPETARYNPLLGVTLASKRETGNLLKYYWIPLTAARGRSNTTNDRAVHGVNGAHTSSIHSKQYTTDEQSNVRLKMPGFNEPADSSCPWRAISHLPHTCYLQFDGSCFSKPRRYAPSSWDATLVLPKILAW